MAGAFEVDLRMVAKELDLLPVPLRLQLELKLRSVAKFAELNPPPSEAFLLLEGIDPASVFRFEVGGYRVRYEVDADAAVVRVVRITHLVSLRLGVKGAKGA